MGKSYSYTLRAGLPSRAGEVLAADATFRVAIPDRDPVLRFPGRGYVLAKGAGAALPIDTVNLDRVDLRLFKVTDRGLIRTIQAQLFNRQIGEWEVEEFAEELATEIWSGQGEVRKARNTDVTTRLPLEAALAGQVPGVYALRARAPGRDEYETPAATQWFVLTDLGLTSWTGADGLHAVVRGLGDAGPKPEVTLTLLSNANAVLGEAVTDAQGVAHFAPGLLRGTGGAAPALLLAQAGEDDMSFLSLKDPAFDLTDRGVAGREPAGAIDVFLTTDRGAYRAGETIHVTALARDGTARALDGLPVTAILTRPDGVEYARQARAEGQAGGYVFAFPVGATVPRGSWTLALKSDLEAPALAQTRVLVEDFLPERIDATLALAGEGPMPLPTAAATCRSRRATFSGRLRADLTVSGSTVLATSDRLEAFPGYRFGRHDAETRRERFYFDSTTTDAAGRATLPVAFDGFEAETPMPALATIYATVTEGSGRPIERRLTQLVLPAEPFHGHPPRLFDDTVPEGTEAAFDLIALTQDLTPAEMEVTWTVQPRHHPLPVVQPVRLLGMGKLHHPDRGHLGHRHPGRRIRSR